MDKLLNKFVEWQKKKHNRLIKILFIIVIPPIFLLFVLSPSLLLSKNIDEMLALPKILIPTLNVYLGIPLFIIGLTLFIWTTLLFFRVGEGTQIPLMPTQKLVTSGPFAYCRNPMVLGVILFISGLGVLFNSFSFITVGLVIPSLYLIYIKFIEEKELMIRFGQEYFEYKKHVRFLIPYLW